MACLMELVFALTLGSVPHSGIALLMPDKDQTLVTG